MAPTYVGAIGVSDLVAATLSGVLALPLEQGLLANVSNSLSLLTSSVQDSLAVGEPQKNFNTKNARIGASVKDANQLADADFIPPQSEAEMFNNKPVTKMKMNITAGSANALGVSVVQYKNNPSGAKTDSTPIGMQTTRYGAATRRRRMSIVEADTEVDMYGADMGDVFGEGSGPGQRDRRLSASDMHVTIVLQNAKEVTYFVIPDAPGNASCYPASASYNTTVQCPEYNVTSGSIFNQSYAFECNQNALRNYSYTCPGTDNLPQCRMWDGTAFSVDPDCQVVSYTSLNTTCLCEVSSSRRRLSATQLAQSELNQFSSQGTIVARGFTRTLGRLGTLGEDDDCGDPGNCGKKSPGEKFTKLVGKNTLIFATMGTILMSFVVGIYITTRKDIKEKKDWRHKERSLKKVKKLLNESANVEKFFNSSIPTAYSGKPWYVRWYMKVVDDHDWIAIFLPYNPDRGDSFMRFTVGMGKVLNFLFIDTILAGLFFADDGSCELYTNESECEFTRALNQVDSLCTWTFDTEGYNNLTAYYNATSFNGTELAPLFGSCAFTTMSEDFMALLLLTIMLTTFTVPLDAMVDAMVGKVEGIYKRSTEPELEDEELEEDDKEGEEIDEDNDDEFLKGKRVFSLEMNGYETMATTMLRGARLDKMQSMMDRATPEDEAKVLIHELEHDSFHQKLVNVVRDSRLTDQPEERHAGQRFSDVIYNFFHNIWLEREDHGDTDAAAKIIFAERNGRSGIVLKSINKARVRADAIADEIAEMDDECDQDALLLQRFISDSLSGFKRRIAEEFLFTDDSQEEVGLWEGRIYMGLITMYVLFTCLYIFLFGVGLGAESTTMWLNGWALAFSVEVFILQPARIWFRYILVAGVTNKRVRLIHGTLRSRARGIMQRKQGIMRDAGSLIQHMNPACRAARQHPHLPISRLLMSLNDYDLPVSNLEAVGVSKGLANMIAQLFLLLFMIFLALLYLLPADFQDMVVDTVVSLFTGAFMGFFYALSEVHIALCLSVFAAVCILFCVYEYRVYKANQANKWEVIKPIEDEDEDQLLEEKAFLEPKAKAEKKYLAKSNWRAMFNKRSKLGNFFSKFGSQRAGGERQEDESENSLQAKHLWPELSQKNLKGKDLLKEVPHVGSHAVAKLKKIARRDAKKEWVSEFDSHQDLAQEDLDSMFSGETSSSSPNKKNIENEAFSSKKNNNNKQAKQAEVEETMDEKMARLHPGATSKNIPSRQAIRALKKDENEKQAVSKINLELIEDKIDEIEDYFNFFD